MSRLCECGCGLQVKKNASRFASRACANKANITKTKPAEDHPWRNINSIEQRK